MLVPGSENTFRPSVGLAYSSGVRRFIERHQDELDHVEIPFELLRHDPATYGLHGGLPVILHCASLSIAGTQRCGERTISEIQAWTRQTATPWIGEHLAFITAQRSQAGPHAEEYAPDEPYNIGYTVSPVMNERGVARVVEALSFYESHFPVPILIENSPLYFKAPGSTMTQSAFITAICAQTRVGLLFDLAHFVITSRLAKFDPFEELDKLPLHRVVELHISGVDDQANGCWDDHTKPAPDIVYQLFDQVLQRASPRAVTLEYNWSPRFPHSLFSEELARVREALRRKPG
jgi:uncharacterized protein